MSRAGAVGMLQVWLRDQETSTGGRFHFHQFATARHVLCSQYGLLSTKQRTPRMAGITLPQIREHLYSAVVCDALDKLGLKNQSPRVLIRPLTTTGVLGGRCRTTLWAEMSHE